MLHVNQAYCTQVRNAVSSQEISLLESPQCSDISRIFLTRRKNKNICVVLIVYDQVWQAHHH